MAKKTIRKINYTRIIPFVIVFILILMVVLVVHALLRWNNTYTEIVIDEKYVNDDIMAEVENYYGLYPVSLIRPADEDDGVNTCLVIGNDTLAYSKDGESIAHILTEYLDAETSVAAFPGTTITSLTPEEHTDSTDYFDLFWLMYAMSFNNYEELDKAVETLPSTVNSQLYKSSLETLKSVDLDNLDYLILYYDAHDYTSGYTFYDENDTSFHSMMYSFYQGLTNMLLVHYPYIQVIVVSPTYCVYMDEDGVAHDSETTVLSDRTLPNGLTTLRDGCIVTNDSENYKGSTSYIDNYYGIKLSSENAKELLLSDGITPNRETRKKIAENIVTFFNSALSANNSDPAE